MTGSVGDPLCHMANREVCGRRAELLVKSLRPWSFMRFSLCSACGIYAVLVQNIAVGDDITVQSGVPGLYGAAVLHLFRTGSLAKSLFGAH